jgi:hypothetical protein
MISLWILCSRQQKFQELESLLYIVALYHIFVLSGLHLDHLLDVSKGHVSSIRRVCCSFRPDSVRIR